MWINLKKIFFNMILSQNIYSIKEIYIYKILQNFNLILEKKYGKKIYCEPLKNTVTIIDDIENLNTATKKPFKLTKPIFQKIDMRKNFIDTPELNLITQKLKNMQSDHHRRLCIKFLLFFDVIKIIFILCIFISPWLQVFFPFLKKYLQISRINPWKNFIVLIFLSVVMDIIAILIPFQKSIIFTYLLLIILSSYYIVREDKEDIIFRFFLVIIYWGYCIIPYLMMKNYKKKSVKHKNLIKKLETFNVKDPITHNTLVSKTKKNPIINI
jgi:hypothetical protein